MKSPNITEKQQSKIFKSFVPLFNLLFNLQLFIYERIKQIQKSARKTNKNTYDKTEQRAGQETSSVEQNTHFKTGPFDTENPCPYCDAVFLRGEFLKNGSHPAFCCNHGKIKLPKLPQLDFI